MDFCQSFDGFSTFGSAAESAFVTLRSAKAYLENHVEPCQGSYGFSRDLSWPIVMWNVAISSTNMVAKRYDIYIYIYYIYT